MAKATIKVTQIKSTSGRLKSHRACVAGLGFGLFFNYQVMPYIERGELKIFFDEFEPEPLPLNLVFPHTRFMATRVRTLVDWLCQDLKQSLAL